MSKNKIKCFICKKEFLAIKPAHLVKHNISMRDYKLKFPNSKLVSDNFKKVMSKRTKEYIKNNPKKWENKVKKITKIMQSPEMRKKKSEFLKKQFAENPLLRKKQSDNLKKLRKSDLWKEVDKKRIETLKSKNFKSKRSEFMKKYHKENPEARINQAKKLSKWMEENPEKWDKAKKQSAKTRRSSSFREKTSKKVKGFLENNPTFLEKLKERARNMWKNEEAVRKILKNKDLRPNKAELKLIQLFKEENLPYKYVGDFKLMINGRNPDFVNIEGQKKLIELFGKFWHTERLSNITPKKHVKDRKSHFKKLGYDTLIIWDYELKDPNKVIKKIKAF